MGGHRAGPRQRIWQRLHDRSHWRLTGIVRLDQLRAAVRKGAHLDVIRLGDLAVKWDTASNSETLIPILDEKNRIVGMHFHPESKFIPVSEPDLSHLELRNLVDAYLSTWISSIGEYIARLSRLGSQGRRCPWRGNSQWNRIPATGPRGARRR